MSQTEKKRTKVELKIEQKWQIIDYHQKNPNIKQVAFIQYFNKLQMGIYFVISFITKCIIFELIYK
jgi:hypothetical protein